MKKKEKADDVTGGSPTYIKPSTKKHKPVDIVKGTGGSGGYYYYYYSLYTYYYYYYSLYYCWVAREVYGADNPQWLVFRDWLLKSGPVWFRKLYGRYGERFARYISDKPRVKAFIRRWMDKRSEGRAWIDGEVWCIS